MQLGPLFTAYEKDRKAKPDSLNHLLDFYQEKYIAGEIDIRTYRAIFSQLHEQGATSAHEYSLS